MTPQGRIGFMQGRLSPMRNGRIQSFPWNHWQQEFQIAARLGFGLMEWTLDQESLYENPLLTAAGQAAIKDACQRYDLTIQSLTCDCFMQSPFWKVAADERETLQQDFLAVAQACATVGIEMMVVPLVDNGSLKNAEQEDGLVSFLQTLSKWLVGRRLVVVFESDFGPEELARFIGRLDRDCFGINYDIGNSAALGFDPTQEISMYGSRILNVHIKDRLLGGTTVPLGTGNADFDAVFAALAKIGYRGKYILQTARAADDDHAAVLCQYRDMTLGWLRNHGA